MDDFRTREENIQDKPRASYFVRKQERSGKQQQSRGAHQRDIGAK